jgi:hypothetical protein
MEFAQVARPLPSFALEDDSRDWMSPSSPYQRSPSFHGLPHQFASFDDCADSFDLHESNNDEDFQRALKDPLLTVNPFRLGFIPKSLWPNQEVSFGALVCSFFQRRNTSSGRFAHKLFNALRIASECPDLRRHLGVEWVSSRVLRVDKRVFARLLAIKVVEGALFHRQGDFPSHGFVEVTGENSEMMAEFSGGFDQDNVRYFIHGEGLFTRESTDQEIGNCKWFNNRNDRKQRIASAGKRIGEEGEDAVGGLQEEGGRNGMGTSDEMNGGA